MPQLSALVLLGEHLPHERRLWRALAELNDNFRSLGYFIVGLFAPSWIVSIAFYNGVDSTVSNLSPKKSLL
jgi:high-affinity nickel-transport protein